MRRADYSVPANIVEGASRESKKDYLHFLYIARGSLSETQYFIHLARRLGYFSSQETDALQQPGRIWVNRDAGTDLPQDLCLLEHTYLEASRAQRQRSETILQRALLPNFYGVTAFQTFHFSG